MSDTIFRRSIAKRILLIVGGLVLLTVMIALACRVAVEEVFRSIQSERATGLSAVAWDMRSMWGQRGSVDSARIDMGSDDTKISRSAELRTYSSSFDRSVGELNQVVVAHHGHLEDLRTESRSNHGRILSAVLSVPSPEFDSAVAALKKIGRVETIFEGGEDSAVKLASAARHLAEMHINLDHLQRLQRDRKGELRDATALEKEIAQARQTVTEAERQHETLLSTVARANIRFSLVEEYRAPLEANLTVVALRLRNALVEGITAIFSSVAIFVGALLEYGLPLLFWIALLAWPSRLIWRRIHPRVPGQVAVE